MWLRLWVVVVGMAEERRGEERIAEDSRGYERIERIGEGEEWRGAE